MPSCTASCSPCVQGPTGSRPPSLICRDGWRTSNSRVPNPWVALAARPHLNLLRAPIAEPGRYYADLATIVLRTGLLLCEERRHLWHELVHADRQDRACESSARVERSVDREAARRALPLSSLLWAFGTAATHAEVVEMLKLPADWIQFRLRTAHPAEKAAVRRSVDTRDEGVA